MAIALTPLVRVAEQGEVVKSGSTPAAAAKLVRKGLTIHAPDLQFAANVLLHLGLTEDQVADRVSTAMGDMAPVAKHGSTHNEKSHGRRYHVAPSSARPSILAHGLDHSRGQSAYTAMDFPAGNYLFTSEQAALEYASVREREEADEYGLDAETYDIYEVEWEGPTSLDPFADDPSGLGEFSVYVTEVIPPSAVRLQVAKHLPGRHDQKSHGRRGSVSALFRRGKAGGFTFHIGKRSYPARGYAVAVPGNSLITPASSFTPEALADYLDTHSPTFAANPHLHLGGWYDSKNDEMVLDLVEVFEDANQAIEAGIARDEQAIFDLFNLEEIPTGGTGGRDG